MKHENYVGTYAQGAKALMICWHGCPEASASYALTPIRTPEFAIAPGISHKSGWFRRQTIMGAVIPMEQLDRPFGT